MTSHLQSVIVFFLLQLLLNATSIQELSAINGLLIKEANSTGPGVWLRLTPAGTSYMAAMVARLLAPEIVRAQMSFETKQLIKLPTISLSSMKLHELVITDVTSFITASNLIAIRTKNSIIRVDAVGRGQIDKIIFNGPIEMRSHHFELDVYIDIKQNNRGNPGFKVEMCRVGTNVPITVIVKSVLEPQSRAKLMEAVSRDAYKLLQDLICPRVTYLMERRVNQRLSLLTTRIALDDLHKFDLVKSFTTSKREFERNNNTRRMDMRRDSPLEHVLSSISQARRQQRFHKLSSKLNLFYRDSLTLDYSMLNTPVISERGVEMATSGEISSPGSRTPFGPPPFIQHPAVSSNLLQLVVSDYVPNTLMYHGHKYEDNIDSLARQIKAIVNDRVVDVMDKMIGIFNTRIDPSTPQFGQMMHTTCGMNSESLFCIGDLFPTLREILPNRDIIFLFSTLEAPVVIVRSLERGGVHFQMLGLIEVFSMERNGETPRGSVEIYIEASMNMRLTSRSVRGKLNLETLKMTTRSPQYFVQSELDDASYLSFDMLQRIVNGILKRGVPIPIHPLFKLQKPTLTFIERSMLLETNFDLNPNLIRQLTSEKLT